MIALKDIFTRQAPKVLYHYTDANSFLGIVGNKELWASHIRFMNDLKEETLALDILGKILVNSLHEKHLNADDVLKYVKDFFAKETVKKDIFILSFSENRDDLNQWRGYANKIPAYCIGFDVEKLIASLDNKTDIEIIKKSLRGSLGDNESKSLKFLLPCIYEKEEQENLLDEVIKDSQNYLDESSYTERQLGKEIANRLVFYSPLIKHKMSESEKEWRIIIVNRDSDNAEQCNFRMGKSFIIPYFKFHFEKSCFKEFIIGACPDKESVKESTIYFLSKKGFSYSKAEDIIKFTNNPYRNW